MNVCKSSSNLPQGPRKMHISSFLLSSLSQTPEHKAQERSACEGRPYSSPWQGFGCLFWWGGGKNTDLNTKYMFYKEQGLALENRKRYSQSLKVTKKLESWIKVFVERLPPTGKRCLTQQSWTLRLVKWCHLLFTPRHAEMPWPSLTHACFDVIKGNAFINPLSGG